MENTTLEKLPNDVKLFISDLVNNGIPLKQINTNDFESCVNRHIYITIPYGNRHGGKFKRVRNVFNKRAVNSCVRFWNKHVLI